MDSLFNGIPSLPPSSSPSLSPLSINRKPYPSAQMPRLAMGPGKRGPGGNSDVSSVVSVVSGANMNSDSDKEEAQRHRDREEERARK